MRDYSAHSFQIVRIISTETNKNNMTLRHSLRTDRCFENLFTLFFFCCYYRRTTHPWEKPMLTIIFSMPSNRIEISNRNTYTNREKDRARVRVRKRDEEMKQLKSSNAATLAHRLHFSATLSAREHLVFV